MNNNYCKAGDIRVNMSSGKEIVIVFSVNDSYVYVGYNAIYSLRKYIASAFDYKIYVFVTDLNNDSIKRLESLSKTNFIVKCLDISDYVKNVTLKKSMHLSVETYYRLFIPLVLSQYKKVLYLDSDICVLDDVSNLYNCNLDGFPVGAVKDVQCPYLKKHSLTIGGLDYKATFNAGVILIDTEKFEAGSIRDKCIELLQNDYNSEKRKFIFADQDVLNIVLYKNIKELPDEWNVQPQYGDRLDILEEDYRGYYLKCLKKAKIMHYAGERKPWLVPNLFKSEVFWGTTKDSNTFEDIINVLLTDINKRMSKYNCFDMFQFPYGFIDYRSKIVIYGAGRVGNDFVIQNSLTRYSDIVLWIDKNADKIMDDRVVNVNKILECKYDFVVVAISEEIVAKKAITQLNKLGVPAEKIIWTEYRMP